MKTTTPRKALADIEATIAQLENIAYDWNYRTNDYRVRDGYARQSAEKLAGDLRSLLPWNGLDSLYTDLPYIHQAALRLLEQVDGQSGDPRRYALDQTTRKVSTLTALNTLAYL
jgi:hypothetical protein